MGKNSHAGTYSSKFNPVKLAELLKCCMSFPTVRCDELLLV